jgi:RNA polymerase sigma-70 factor, ECF subfamily
MEAQIPALEHGADFEQVVRTRERMVLAAAWRLLGSVDDARDAAQEVFLRLFRQWPRLPADARIEAWLYRVTVNVCFDVRARRRATVEVPDDLTNQSPGAQAEIEARERRDMLIAALARLPERERTAIVLREIEELSTAEVAEAMGVSEATVRSQISMGRARLKKLLEAQI